MGPKAHNQSQQQKLHWPTEIEYAVDGSECVPTLFSEINERGHNQGAIGLFGESKDTEEMLQLISVTTHA